MRDDNCIFCKIANGEIPSATLYEDEEFRVILDLGPASKGHALILPKNHYRNLYDIDEATASKAICLAKKMITKMTDVLGCDGYNIVQNNEEAAGQTVFHFHMHLIPRYKNDNVGLGWHMGELTEEDKKEKIVFSRHIGNLNQPLIKDPVYIKEADYVVMESTYGDRSHGERPDYPAILAEIIQRTFDRGGSLVIPSFAVGRTQEMLYFIRQIKEQGLVHGHDGFTVYVDSPLANEATTIFSENAYTCYDEEAMDLLNKGINPLSFQGLKTSVTTDDSRAINFDEDCKVIISASGMCDAGRIKHHLKHNLWNPRNTILFVGYQAIGTPGRALLEGAVELKLFGETVQVAAEICKMPGISGHADVNGLIEWAKAFETRPKHVFVTHGDDTVTEIFAQRLKEELGYDATAPFSGTEYDLLENRCIHEAVGVRIVKATASPKTTKAARAYEKLLAMGRRLMSVIRKNEGCPNKDLDRFARDIQSLCDKWDRTDI